MTITEDEYQYYLRAAMFGAGGRIRNGDEPGDVLHDALLETYRRDGTWRPAPLRVTRVAGNLGAAVRAERWIGRFGTSVPTVGRREFGADLPHDTHYAENNPASESRTDDEAINNILWEALTEAARTQPEARVLVDYVEGLDLPELESRHGRLAVFVLAHGRLEGDRVVGIPKVEDKSWKDRPGATIRRRRAV